MQEDVGCRSNTGRIDDAIPFVTAWEAHHRAVYRACLAFARGRREDAEEVFSRVAMQSFQKWPLRLQDAAHARAWLLTVARNACVDLFRERGRSREVSLETIVPGVLVARGADPERALLRDEHWRTLRTAMRGLPFRLRVVAEMHFLAEIGYHDIACELGISELNVRKRVQQARAALRGEAGAAPWPARRSHSEPAPAEAPLAAFPVRVTADDGVEREVILELRLTGRPRPQRCESLQQYIKEHPRGCLKRLELARVLAAGGRCREAIGHYRFVVARQPFPIRPWVELGMMLEAIGRRCDAAAVYADGARQVGREADRETLRRLAAEIHKTAPPACL